jgi:hypothetical protein
VAQVLIEDICGGIRGLIHELRATEIAALSTIGAGVVAGRRRNCCFGKQLRIWIVVGHPDLSDNPATIIREFA